MFDVCVVGSLNLDLVATSARLPAPGETVLGDGFAEHAGGKGLNQVVAAARAGATTAMVGAVGDDAAAELLTRVLHDDGVDTSMLQRLDGSTGRAVILVDRAAENSIVVIAGANAALAVTSIPPARVVVAQLEVPVATVAAAFHHAREAGATTVLNPSPVQPLADSLWEVCDVVVANEHEATELGGAAGLLDRGVAAVVVTRGAAGVSLHTSGGVVEQPAFPVLPVDTTGAGDAFCGAFAARLAAGDDLETAVRWGAAAGAVATTAHGAVPSLPHGDAVRAVLSGA